MPEFVPESLVLTERSNTALHGGDGEDVHADVCPANQVLVGARGSLLLEALGEGAPPWVSSIAAICAEVSLVSDAATGVSIGGTATLQERGAVRDMPWTQRCPEGQIVVGMSGRAGAALDQISIICAAFEASASAGRLVRANDTALGLPLAGGTGGTEFEEWCPDHQVASGLLVRAGGWVDALGMSCATPTLVLSREKM